MTTSATIPVTVNPNAVGGIAYYRLQAAVERMIDHARRHLPEVERIEVSRVDRYEDGEEPIISIAAYSRRPFNPAEHFSRELGGWMVRNCRPRFWNTCTSPITRGPVARTRGELCQPVAHTSDATTLWPDSACAQHGGRCATPPRGVGAGAPRPAPLRQAWFSPG
jgi:hypothetical protein